MNQTNRYLTLCNSEKYLKGTLVLYESLCATNTDVPLVVFCPKKTPEKVRTILKQYAALSNDKLCKLEILETEQDITLPPEISEKNKQSRWSGTFDKLMVFGFAQFKKIIFIDSDMLVLRNIDHLFARPHLSACSDGQYDKNNLNSGLMVIEPTNNSVELARIEQYLSEVYSQPQFGDQDVIRLAFPEWRVNKELRLPEQYNLFFENVAQKKKELNYDLFSSTADKQIYVVHFIGYDKPWYQGKQLKWKIYNISWKTKMLLCARKKYKNNVTVKILFIYHYFLRKAMRKLKKFKVKIYEMDCV